MAKSVNREIIFAMRHSTIRAIIWDYDGTLADTRHKNLMVTRKIVEHITGRGAEEFPALQSLENYMAVTKKATNWREMYMAEYGMTVAQTDKAGRLWTEYQLQDTTYIPFYDGIDEILRTLQHFPHGIVSQNARSNIVNALQQQGLSEYFTCIIGFEEVDIKRQKPEPDGLLLCIEKLTRFTPGYILYIGDHETDVKCAHNTNDELKKDCLDIQVITVAVFHNSDVGHSDWMFTPDYTADTAEDIIRIVERLC
jgi:HAD superfamily hydrolase (TIGR01549 family)